VDFALSSDHCANLPLWENAKRRVRWSGVELVIEQAQGGSEE
jgi:hypothetical protein